MANIKGGTGGRKYSDADRIKIYKDFITNNLSSKEVCEKYKMTRQAFHNLKKSFEPANPELIKTLKKAECIGVMNKSLKDEAKHNNEIIILNQHIIMDKQKYLLDAYEQTKECIYLIIKGVHRNLLEVDKVDDIIQRTAILEKCTTTIKGLSKDSFLDKSNAPEKEQDIIINIVGK